MFWSLLEVQIHCLPGSLVKHLDSFPQPEAQLCVRVEFLSSGSV